MKRHTHRKKKVEFRPFTIKDWLRLFSEGIRRTEVLVNIGPKVEKKIKKQADTQLIGQIRERKVIAALEGLKERGEIRGYLPSGGLSYAHLIQGVSFTLVYVNKTYKTCSFSATGPKWIKQHLEKHPEVPILSIDLGESKKSIQRKILALFKEQADPGDRIGAVV